MKNVLLGLFLFLSLISCENKNFGHIDNEIQMDSLFDSRLEVHDRQPPIDSVGLFVDNDSLYLSIFEDAAEDGSELKRLIIHTTASDIKKPYTKETLLRFFKEARLWSKPGYTFFFDRQGVIWKLNKYWDWDPVVNYYEITFGAKGYNSSSLHVAWDGGLDNGKIVDNRTPEQKIAMLNFVKIVKDIYPSIEIIGHRDLPGVNKLCPIFDVKKEYSKLNM